MKGKTIFRVQGLLDKKWQSTFDDFSICYEGNNTLLSGNLKDEAHMHGILNQLRNLNLKLISINLAENENNINLINNKS